MFEVNGCAPKIVVVKVGGSVLTNKNSFHRVALFLKERSTSLPEERLVVVVSAQKKITDALERRACGIVGSPGVRALDLLWATGELRSVSLLALHLEAVGIPSVGFNVHETGLQFGTDYEPCLARPVLANRHLKNALAAHAVVVVPGFLATRSDGAIVSLGRGGSDLSAVLLAIGLKALRCELVKDVPGYFENDPAENAGARHMPTLSFQQAIRLAEDGCELIQLRALSAAAEAGLPLVIRSLDQTAPSSVVLPAETHRHSEDDKPVAAFGS